METLTQAYKRLHRTGSEYDGGLSNHGPMVVEALVARGRSRDVDTWLARYLLRLDDAPTSAGRIIDWQESLGDRSMLTAWVNLFAEELREHHWPEVLATWWPRLLPGIAGGATHGVIRVGHAVRALRTADEPVAMTDELAQALGYWASRWRPVPEAARPSGTLTVAEALDAVPAVPQQAMGVSARLGQLAVLAGWPEAQGGVDPGPIPEQFLREVVTEALRVYARSARANPVMLVHMATAPNAVLRVLPSLPCELHAASAAMAWTAAAALQAAYVPAARADHTVVAPAAADVTGAGAEASVRAFDRAVWHGDEHAVKLADTAVDVYAWTADPSVLDAVTVATTLIGRP